MARTGRVGGATHGAAADATLVALRDSFAGAKKEHGEWMVPWTPALATAAARAMPGGVAGK
jgi:hypothetical protein